MTIVLRTTLSKLGELGENITISNLPMKSVLVKLLF
jgi:hypothetical protein